MALQRPFPLPSPSHFVCTCPRGLDRLQEALSVYGTPGTCYLRPSEEKDSQCEGTDPIYCLSA